MAVIGVTGGNGFIGRYTTRELVARGHDVIVLDRLGAAPEPGATLFLGDIRDRTTVDEFMAHVDRWVHLAGVLGTQETIDDPFPAADTNISGALNVLESAATRGLHGVNIAVGNHWEQNTYSITKACADRFADMYRRYRGLSVTTVRAFNAYGPGQSVAAPYGPSKVRKIVPSFVMRALHHEPIEVYGDGQQVMDMIHVADVARVLAIAVESDPLPLIEAGTGRPTTVLDIAKEVAVAVGGSTIHHLPLRPGETPGAVVLADTTTLSTVLDLDSLVTLEDGIAETVDWYRNRL